LTAFDLPDASAPNGARESTNVPNQALFLLNSDFVAEQSRFLAEAILNEYPARAAVDRLDERLNYLFLRILNRRPAENEFGMAKRLLESMLAEPIVNWTSLVRGLFATAEFRSLD